MSTVTQEQLDEAIEMLTQARSRSHETKNNLYRLIGQEAVEDYKGIKTNTRLVECIREAEESYRISCLAVANCEQIVKELEYRTKFDY